MIKPLEYSIDKTDREVYDVNFNELRNAVIYRVRRWLRSEGMSSQSVRAWTVHVVAEQSGNALFSMSYNGGTVSDLNYFVTVIKIEFNDREECEMLNVGKAPAEAIKEFKPLVVKDITLQKRLHEHTASLAQALVSAIPDCSSPYDFAYWYVSKKVDEGFNASLDTSSLMYVEVVREYKKNEYLRFRNR